MTDRRQKTLDFVIESLGHENPFTLAFCTISEERPEKEFDGILSDLAETYVMRYDEALSLEEPEEDDYDHPDYDPYCGCDMPDIFGLEW